MSQSGTPSRSSGSSIPCDTGSSSRSKKVRGPNKMLNMPTTDRPLVQFDNLGLPFDTYQRKLSSCIGIVARDSAVIPVNVFDWRLVSVAAKTRAFDMVQSRFDFGDQVDVASKYVMEKMDTLWKAWKHKLKEIYDKCQTNEERLAKLENRVIEAQFLNLVEYWDSEKGKKRSDTNIVNQGQQKTSHTCGTKTLHRLRHEKEAVYGHELDPIEMYKESHLRKNKNWVDLHSEATYARFDERLSQVADPSDRTTRNEVYAEIMGPEQRNRIRGYGLGVKYDEIFGSQQSPNAEAVRIAEERAAEEQRRREAAEAQVKHCMDEVARLHARFDSLERGQNHRRDDCDEN